MNFEEWGEIVRIMKRDRASPHQDLEVLVEVVQWSGSPRYRPEIKTRIADSRVDSGEELPETVRGLRSGVEVIERWPSGAVPGELSQQVYSKEYLGYTTSLLTAKARDEYRWIEYRVTYDRRPSTWINLSTPQALQLATELERAPQVAQEMIDFLESMDGN